MQLIRDFVKLMNKVGTPNPRMQSQQLEQQRQQLKHSKVKIRRNINKFIGNIILYYFIGNLIFSENHKHNIILQNNFAMDYHSLFSIQLKAEYRC
jgi:uncharacterized membrane protein (DUF106 family)